MTLEATLLCQVILMTLFFLLYMGFYAYDACLGKQDACLIAVAGEIPYKAERANRYVKKALAERYPEKYLAYRQLGAKGETTGDKVSVTLSGQVVVPIGGSFFPEGKGKLTTEATVEAKRMNAVDFIRNIRKVELFAELFSDDQESGE